MKKFKALLATLGLLSILVIGGVAAQAPATADASFCGTGYTRVDYHTFTNHRVDLYRKGTNNSWCSILYATNDMYGTTHYMETKLLGNTLSCTNVDADGGQYAYYAGPTHIPCGSSVLYTYKWQAPSGTYYSGSYVYP
jgi:hypothetical protein